jgi:hypothetical protein
MFALAAVHEGEGDREKRNHQRRALRGARTAEAWEERVGCWNISRNAREVDTGQ